MNPADFRFRRTSLQLSQSQLAEHIGITASQIDLAERAVISAEVTFLLNMALSILELQKPAASWHPAMAQADGLVQATA